MGANTKIEWATHTFNPWIGCTKVSPGCDHCYAEALDKRKIWEGATHWGPGVPRMRTSKLAWRAPRLWDVRQREHEEECKARGVSPVSRPRVFTASLADVADPEVPQAWRDDHYALVDATPHLNHLLLTKRPQVLAAMLPGRWFADGIRPGQNVWVGTTIEDQERVPRLGHLRRIPAAVHFLSVEPMLGPVVLPTPIPRLWVICGGESGPGARPFFLEWALRLYAQCRDAGVPFFMKQLGSNAYYHGKPYPTKDRKGGDPSEWPAALQVRGLPVAALAA